VLFLLVALFYFHSIVGSNGSRGHDGPSGSKGSNGAVGQAGVQGHNANITFRVLDGNGNVFEESPHKFNLQVKSTTVRLLL
jgi:hypothetical protein